MATQFILLDRDTPYILPPCVQDYLPEDHMAHFVVDIVDQLDLRALSSAYVGKGKSPYHPAMLLAVLFYGYATGVFSSRKLEKATYDSMAFKYICANENPDHDTINSFRKRFGKEIEGLFVEILVLAEAMGLLKLGTVSLDGTKIKANASKHKALSWDHAKQLETQFRQEIDTLMKLAEAADNTPLPEDINVPQELKRRQDRLAVIAKAKQEIELALAKLGLLPECLGTVENLLADTGYFSQENVKACCGATIKPYITQKRQRHNQPLEARHQHKPEIDETGLQPLEAMTHRLTTKTGKALYGKRKSTVETAFGIIKHVLGFRQFLCRGLKSVQREWNLVCIGWNLKRMYVLNG